jgi:hypothetical protein
VAAGESVQLHREVAVGVPDGPERDEVADVKARLLAKLPSGRGFGTFAGLDMAARELPEAREETGRRSALDEPPAAVGQDDDRRPDLRPASAARAPRQRPRVRELSMRAARERDRAARTIWAGRPTGRFPELHDRLVELAGVRPRQD